MLPIRRHLPQGLAIATQSAEFWRRLAPELTISNARPGQTISRNQRRLAVERMQLVNDGYLRLKQPGIEAPLVDIARAMDRIVKAGLPAAFIGVYDEVWSAIAALDVVINGLFDGQGALVPNFWASHLAAGPGLAAQRRRPKKGVFSDGTPKSITVWLPVTDATPDNGCVYLVPAGQDRNYGKPEADRADASLPGIRALPAVVGDVLIWTGEAYHWQSRPERAARHAPLQSLTWEFQSRDIAPLEGLLVDSFPDVPFETRLGLLAHQMPRHQRELSVNPIWRAVQQTLANRFPMRATG